MQKAVSFVQRGRGTSASKNVHSPFKRIFEFYLPYQIIKRSLFATKCLGNFGVPWELHFSQGKNSKTALFKNFRQYYEIRNNVSVR